MIQSMVEEVRNNQFVSSKRKPAMVKFIENDGDVIIRPTTVSSNNKDKEAILVMPKNIEDFKEFKEWANNQSIPVYCTQLDEYQRSCGIVLWDGMPLNNTQSWSSMVIRMDVEIEASGEDIISVMLRYYSI